MLLLSVIVTLDEGHLFLCHDEECHYCAMIHNAQNLIDSLIIIGVIYLYFTIIYTISKIFEKNYFISKTLINSKVQFNE